MKGQCDICGIRASDVRARLSEMTEDWTPRYQTLDRCKDSIACRARCEALGEPWPIEAAVLPGDITAAVEAPR